MSLEQRFWAKVDVAGEEECWLWTAYKRNGYGRINIGGNPKLAHRVAYELTCGSIPDGLTLDHICRNRACVNPKHLDPVPMRENSLRGEGIPAVNSRKTHCPHGHEYTEGNTYHHPRGSYPPSRTCRVCMRARANSYYHQNKHKKGLAPNDPRHGTATGYGNHLCRCEACRNAWNEYKRQNYRRRKQQKEGV